MPSIPPELGAIGGVLSFVISLVSAGAAIASWRANRAMAQANASMAKSNRMSATIAKRSLAHTDASLRDQVETNRAARAAFVDIISATYTHVNPEPATQLEFLPYRARDTVATIDFEIINRGAAPAYRVIASDAENDRRLFEGKRWTLGDPGYLYTEYPVESWDVVLPSERREGQFSVRDIRREGDAETGLDLVFTVTFSDSLGLHEQSFSITFFPIVRPFPGVGLISEVRESRDRVRGLVCPPPSA
jgi:hypothetical protein